MDPYESEFSYRMAMYWMMFWFLVGFPAFVAAVVLRPWEWL